MTDYRKWFIEFNNQFKFDGLYFAMLNTVENSPWHREANTALHTDMVVSEYLSRTPEVWHKDHLKGALACLFHDVGKPGAKTEHYTPERGNYFKFLEHELLSTRLFEDYVVRNWKQMSEVLVAQDIYDIGWLIQHHLPYKVAKHDKLVALLSTVHFVLPHYPDVFATVLLSDQYGRISDNHQVNKDEAHQWISWFYSFKSHIDAPMKNANKDKPTLTVFVGASSSGKSTCKYGNIIPVPSIEYSWDTYRLMDFPHPQIDTCTPSEAYSHAFNMACEDKTFYDRCRDRFVKLIKNRDNIVLDNMNLTNKSRSQFTDLASTHGYHIQFLMFPVSMSQLIERGHNRKDRSIGDDAIINMYNRLTYPSISLRCHDVIVIDSNLKDETTRNN